MLNHEHIFYNTVFDEIKEDYDDDFHDELWTVILRTFFNIAVQKKMKNETNFSFSLRKYLAFYLWRSL